ncbi:MAG: hypothetical protein CMB67_00865 [Euryarchaeota archaeon]|nr:hypothetical protein [Euryarchaeota archaeon]
MPDEQDKNSDPPPPPPSGPPPPSPPPSGPPIRKPKQNPSKANPSAKPTGKPQGKRRRRPTGKPQGKRRPTPKKGKPGQPPVGEKKGRRIKIKLGLRAKKLAEETDSYTDQVGWTTSSSETVLSDLKDIDEQANKEPETLTHHCTMCGSRMEIPRPNRERYKVICAHPECGHEDKIGF